MIFNKLAVLVLSLGIGMWVSCTSSAAFGPAQTDPEKFGEEVSVHTVAAMKGKEGVVVLDVREPDEYADAHISGVKHIPMGQVLQRKSEFIDAKVIFVTCRSGNRSGRITDALREQGHTNVHNMAGGIRAWKSAGLPVETGK
ncbi:MAG: rhodanese-like domain-containing protein [Deltaproteobacteria bacterium]|nr:rhodanese-like domain-containing protein [Deltaproteobacteria bacterium]